MKIFFQHWPAPKRMSKTEYQRYRLKLLCFVVALVIYAFLVIYFWGELHPVVKFVLIVLGYFLRPSVDIFEDLFMSYETYLKEGLW